MNPTASPLPPTAVAKGKSLVPTSYDLTGGAWDHPEFERKLPKPIFRMVEVAEPVRAFVKEMNLTDRVLNAIMLACVEFPQGSKISLDLEEDPDEGDRWVVLRVTTSQSIEEVLAASAAYTAKWVAEAPSPERFLVRLAYHLS